MTDQASPSIPANFRSISRALNALGMNPTGAACRHLAKTPQSARKGWKLSRNVGPNRFGQAQAIGAQLCR